MGRDGRETRERLLRAGERVFARSGVRGANLREINTEAGQRNNSAMHYHFGSREGLLQAIASRHQHDIDAERVERFGRMDTGGVQPDVRTIVDIWVRPMASKLASEEGRDYLCILPDLVHMLGRVEGLAPREAATETMDLPGLERVLRELRSLISEEPAPVVTARLLDASHFAAASLAARARQLSTGSRPALGHERYVENLVAMLGGALGAPSSLPESKARA
jgi:TetR/AcrR family transcriptional regulator, regulator of cefoperazone and chloramphenicol sensitivity